MDALNNGVLDNFKMTVLGPLPVEWEIRSVGDLFDIQQGKSLSPKSRTGKSLRPFLRTANVFWGKVDLASLDSMDFSDEEVDRLRLRPSDLLVCEGGEIGRTAIWRGEIDPCCYQNHIHRLRAKKQNVEPEFHMFWMQAAFLLLNLYGGEGNKTTIPNLSQSRLKNFRVPFPPLPEQRTIARVLSTIQRAIEAQDKIIAAAREVKKALMRHLFTYGAVPPTEAERVSLKETEIGMVPEEWGVVRLGNVVQKSKQTDPSRTPNWKFKYVDVSSIDNKRLAITGYTEYLGSNAPSRARKLIKTSDVIFATVRPYLKRIAMVPPNLDGHLCSTAFCVIRARPEIAYPSYLFFAVSDNQFVQKAAEHQRGSSYPAITDSAVLQEQIALPPLPEQRAISHILSVVDSKIETEEKRKVALQTLFKTMLHQMMTGQVRVPIGQKLTPRKAELNPPSGFTELSAVG